MGGSVEFDTRRYHAEQWRNELDGERLEEIAREERMDEALRVMRDPSELRKQIDMRTLADELSAICRNVKIAEGELVGIPGAWNLHALIGACRKLHDELQLYLAGDE